MQETTKYVTEKKKNTFGLICWANRNFSVVQSHLECYVGNIKKKGDTK